jgi:RsiW-degrading membrane proteinase PrsW (M82 family)
MIDILFENPMQTAIMAFLAFIPTVIWGVYFYRKDPEPKKLAIITFFGGTLSVVPLLLYQYSWDYLPWLSLHTYIPLLLNDPSLGMLLYFVGINIVLAFIVFVISVLIVSFVALITWTHGVIRNIYKSIFEEQANFMIFGLFSGIFAILILFFGFSGTEALILTLVLAVMEEFSKHIIVRFTDAQRIQSLDYAIEFSILVGLGFAFTENIFYFLSSYDGGQFYQIVVFRSLLSVFGHILFSGIFGYFYGIAHFASPLYHEEVHKNRHSIIQWLHKVLHLRGSVLFHEEKMMEGLLVAAGMHTFFNFFLQLGNVVVVVPFLFAGYFLLSYLMDKKEDHKIMGYVSDERTTHKIHLMKVGWKSVETSGEIKEFSD